jgi:predicted ATPase
VTGSLTACPLLSFRYRSAKQLMTPSWHVITGPPCSGKTTLIEELRRDGHEVVDEVARSLIDEELREGRSMAEIRGDERAFHYRVAATKLKRDLQLPRGAALVFDRGLPDTIAFGHHYGWPDPEGFSDLDFAELYASVFLLAQVPAPDAGDPARTEAPEEAEAIAQALRSVYIEAGITAVEVPCTTPKQRAALVGAHLRGR